MNLSGRVRDLALGCALLMIAGIALLGRRQHASPAREARAAIPETPVIPARLVPVPAEDEGDEGDEGVEHRKDDRASPASWPKYFASRQQVVTRLRRYAVLVPPRDAEEYLFIVDRLSVASREREEGPEGLLANRLFFAAGGHGRLPRFQRSWVYLLRALGVDIDADRGERITGLVASVWRDGFEETQVLETQYFGRPLEGGRAVDWIDRLPDSELRKQVWEERSQLSMFYYEEFLSALHDEILEPAEYDILADALAALDLGFPPR